MQAFTPSATPLSVVQSKSLRGTLNSIINATSVSQQTQAMTTWKRMM